MIFHRHHAATRGRARCSAPGGAPRRAVRAGCVPARAGISLMEVLISVFVISIGLLGVAALIPVANFALQESSKADRTAACGQAAMREVRMRWAGARDATGNPVIRWVPGNTYVVDPLGEGDPEGPNLQFAQSLGPDALYRIPTNMSVALREFVFHWGDDLLFDMDEASELADYSDWNDLQQEGVIQRVGGWLRPRGFPNPHGVPWMPVPERGYSWFFTVTPHRGQALVSVVVCHGRDPEQLPETQPIDLVLRTGTPSGAIISGIRVLDRPDLEAGQWILLRGPRASADADIWVAQWYRIAVGFRDYYALEGPGWPSGGVAGEIPTEIIIVPGVLGVYTTVVEPHR